MAARDIAQHATTRPGDEHEVQIYTHTTHTHRHMNVDTHTCTQTHRTTCVFAATYIHTHACIYVHTFTHIRITTQRCTFWQGVATISRLLKMIGLFCKRALEKRRYSAKETYNFKEPTNRSHPIFSHMQAPRHTHLRSYAQPHIYTHTCTHAIIYAHTHNHTQVHYSATSGSAVLPAPVSCIKMAIRYIYVISPFFH